MIKYFEIWVQDKHADKLNFHSVSESIRKNRDLHGIHFMVSPVDTICFMDQIRTDAYWRHYAQ